MDTPVCLVLEFADSLMMAGQDFVRVLHAVF